MTRNDSQWAAQFAVAAELVRRGYSVAFYHGNEPLHDMPVRGRKSANQFVLQIKGTQGRPPQKPQAHGPDILVGNATRQELQAIRNPGKQQPKFTSDWVKYPGISRFEDRWDKLPQP